MQMQCVLKRSVWYRLRYSCQLAALDVVLSHACACVMMLLLQWLSCTARQEPAGHGGGAGEGYPLRSSCHSSAAAAAALLPVASQ
jgi:hypothetical protein